jgi:peptidoglycan hydrolase-like protein with peptidoglycan-binding domain
VTDLITHGAGMTRTITTTAAATLSVLATLSIVLAGPAVASPLGPDTAPAPAATTVDMEAVVMAAQIDPRRADTAVTDAAGPSVTYVERALQARGLLAGRFVDGHFGTRTITAYAAWQRSLGLTGLGATGLPNTPSLRALGQGRYVVVRTIGPGGTVTVDGATVNTRTRAMLREAERLIGLDLAIDQGSYNPGGDPTSAGTHDGGGVLDLAVAGMNATTRATVVRALRRVGFAAWLRSPAQGDWPWHIHAVAINDTDLSAPAQHQAGDYHLGRNGLANRAPDDGPRVPKHAWEEYLRRS